MQALIAAILFLIPIAALGQTQSYPQWPQLQFVNPDLGWVINERRIIGHSSRVNLYIGQDPFPFCAAVSASILFDQHRCMTEGRDCRQQPRSSALSLVSASQGKNGRIVWDQGGMTQLALTHLVNFGAANHADCNLDSMPNPRNNKTKDLNELYSSYSNYRTFKKYGGYLTRYNRDEFGYRLRNLGIHRDDYTSLIDEFHINTNDLLTAAVITDNCKISTINSARPYQIKETKIKDFDIEQSHNLIGTQLRNNTPVGINLCLNVLVGFNQCSKHSLVIYAESFARNTITGDVRKIYRVANTWGEIWQKNHNDGWIFADMLMMGIYEIFWLE